MRYPGVMETTASSMFRGAAQPAFDQIDHARRIDFDAPMVFGTIGGRQVVLARPDQRRASPDEPVDVTVPLTMSRLQRAIDIEHSRAVGPYKPSLLHGLGSVLSREYGANLGWQSPDADLEAQLRVESKNACSAGTCASRCPMFYEAWQMTARKADKDKLLWAGIAGGAGLALGALVVAMVMK